MHVFRRILILCFGLLAGPVQAQSNEGGVSLAGLGHDLGGGSARVFIVEFGDFGCGYCAKFAADQFHKIDSAYIKKGIVRWKMVPFVTGMFKNSREVAEAAECAAEQGEFWKMHNLLYEKRKEWMASSDIRKLVAKYANDLRLDKTVFSRCVMSPYIQQRIQRNDAIAQKLGIQGTPTFFVNSRRVPGAIPFELFQQVINEALLR
jgi:protein-disulfide isomerase